MAFDGISNNPNSRKPQAQGGGPASSSGSRKNLDNLFSSEPLLGAQENTPGKGEAQLAFNAVGMPQESNLVSEQRMLEGLRRYQADLKRKSKGQLSDEARYLIESSLFELDEDIQHREDKIRRLK